MMKHLPINPRRSPLTLLHPKRSFFAHSEYCQPSSGICLNTKPNELRHFLEVLLPCRRRVSKKSIFLGAA